MRYSRDWRSGWSTIGKRGHRRRIAWAPSRYRRPRMPDAAPLHIAFLLFPNVTQLDLTGPAQVLSRLGNARLDLVAKSLDPVPTDAQFALLPTATFAGVPHTDILCIPGGFGT